MSKALNIVSTLNSTTTALDTDGTWAGAAEYCYAHASIVVACKTDQDGTLYVDLSTDGTNWDSTLTYKVAAGINEVHRLTVTREYFRVRFVNGSDGAQTYLRLETMLGDFPALSAPKNLSVQQDADAIVTRPTNYNYEVAMGRMSGCTTWNKFGYNADVDSAAAETIWSVGGLFTPLSTASTLTVVSTDAADDAAGTGARSIIIYGIDANREALVEVVELDGTTPVVTTGTFLGVNRAAIYLAGSGGSNAGNININKISAGGSPVVTVRAFVTSLVSGAKYEVFRQVMDTAVENTIELRPSQPFVVGEKSLIEFQATTNINDTVVSIRFSFIEERN